MSTVTEELLYEEDGQELLEPIKKKDLDPKVGFDIGWDFYAYKMLVPVSLKEMKCVMDGFNSAHQRRVKQKNHDRFIKKWLNLRVNAWKRNRLFDKSVTPEAIEAIDEPRCCITFEKLTHNTGSSTDWSVDRVNNNGGYTMGNVVVVSAHANMAKGNYTLDQILLFAYDENTPLPKPEDNIRPLTRHEWARWATVCAHGLLVDSNGEAVSSDITVPCVTFIPAGLGFNIGCLIQSAIADHVYFHFKKVSRMKGKLVSDQFKVVYAGLSKENKKIIQKLVKKAIKTVDFKEDIHLDIWHSVKLYLDYCDFYAGVSEHEKMAIRNGHISRHMAKCIGDATDCDFGFSTGGYNKD